MKILSIYPNADGYGRIPTGLAIIMTVLENAGHTMDLFDTTFLHDANHDNDTRERAKLVKAVEEYVGPQLTSCDGMPVLAYESLSQDAVDELVREKLKASNPDVVLMSIVEDNYNWADRILRVIKDVRRSTPVIVGGPTPSAAPDILIENPNIDYLVQGEGEEAAVELCDLLERGLSVEGVRNLWFKKDGRVRYTPLRPFINLDTLPHQRVDLWDRRHFYKPYDGKIYWTGYFEMSRGCPYLCTYCVNHTIQRSLKDAGKYFRRKTPSVAVKEIKAHKEKYGLRRIVFCDDNFLLMPGPAFKEWGEEFKDAWLSEINLPYWITTSADFIHPETLQLLAETGCDGIGLGVEAGGEWFKRNILKRRLTNQRTVDIFRMVHDYGIRSTANIMMGFPGEYEEDVFESIKLIRRIQPKSFDVSLVAPYVGTDIHTACVKLGLIDTFDKPGFRGMSTEISFRQYSTIRNPHLSRERVSELYDTFVDYVSGAREIPPEYLAPAPGADDTAPPRGDMSRDVADVIKGIKPPQIRHDEVLGEELGDGVVSLQGLRSAKVATV
jgi:anaerobic magnesium-protoporphyrin IX monomethyl ester cyclase